ncbi:antibiotic biosynthesis monooxygenase family protein [Streptomyces sp. NPDC085932]|uniref:antibiotic biosynthesis monooxygenase family protein n=1 Tax=Streptomyces sp. NPDC085932 TaxID=3365741 RepID=UPI0037D3EE90
MEVEARRQVPPHTDNATRRYSTAPVRPVEAFEPPYYVAVFTTVRSPNQTDYGETDARMEERVKDLPGYLGMDHAQTPGGLGITVGYFRDADALTEWRTDAEHRAAQERGRAEWYRSYTLHVAKVERSSGFRSVRAASEAPAARSAGSPTPGTGPR